MINLLLNDDFATMKKALFENSVLPTSFFYEKGKHKPERQIFIYKL